MHIHAGSQSFQSAALNPSQATQQAMETKRAAEVVRRKLSSFAATGDDEDTYRVDAHGEADPNRKQQKQQQDEESFRGVFFSISA